MSKLKKQFHIINEIYKHEQNYQNVKKNNFGDQYCENLIACKCHQNCSNRFERTRKINVHFNLYVMVGFTRTFC